MALKTKQMWKIFEPIETQVIILSITLITSHEFNLLMIFHGYVVWLMFFFQMKKLAELLNNNEENSAEMASIKKLVLDQLYKLANKFENVSKENVDSFQDMKKKITSIIEEFCILDFGKKVRNFNKLIYNKIYYFIIIICYSFNV